MFYIHHILPQKFASHPVIYFLANRFNHDAIGNRMALPSTQGLAAEISSSPHTGGHLGEYYEGFRKYLDDVHTSLRHDATLAGDERALDDVVADLNVLLAAAKYAQANGHLFANTPEGMTTEEANEATRKWFNNWRRYATDNEVQIRQMQETVDQLYDAGRADAAEYWPLLSPTSRLGLEERTDILRRFPKGTPISLQFEAASPVPALPGLAPPFVDTRLPGFLPPPVEVLGHPEGFTPSNPPLIDGVPGFPVFNPALQGLGQLPPSAAMPPLPQMLQFHSETGNLLRSSDGSPLMGPNPYNMPHDPADGPAILRGLAMFGAATAAPVLLPLLPAWAPIAVALGLAGAAASSAARADPTGTTDNGASAARAFDPAVGQAVSDQGAMRAGTFADRFGNWMDTPTGTTPASSRPETPSDPAAQAAVLDDVRRLSRVNEPSSGSAFTIGSAPIPYLPSTEFNDRYGSWRTSNGDWGTQQASKPLGMLADEPSYFIPPSIFDPHPGIHADEWFSRWIRPFLRPD
jgi:hypothetical protein